MKKLLFLLLIPFLSNSQIKKGQNSIKQNTVKQQSTENKEEDACDSITYGFMIDSTNVIYYTTDKLEKVQIIRNIKGLDTNYYAYLRVPGNIILEEPKGIYAIIDEYHKIVQPNSSLELKPNINKDQSNAPYLYTAFIKITELDFMTIAIHGVLGFKLDIFETSLTEEENNILKKATMCVWESKVKITKK